MVRGAVVRGAVVVAVEAASRTLARRRVAFQVFNQREQPLCLDLIARRAHHEHARAVAAADVRADARADEAAAPVPDARADARADAPANARAKLRADDDADP